MKFNQIIKSIIVEQGRYEILKKTYTQPKKKGDKVKPAKMSLEQLNKMVMTDPTTRRDGDNVKKAGKYVNWILKQFLQIEPNIEADYGTKAFKVERTEKLRLFFEDLYKVTQDLKKFDRFKDKLESGDRDISKLSIDRLNDLMLPYSLEKTKATKDEKEKASKTYDHPGGEVVFRGSKWTVVRISDSGKLGKDAACFYGGNDQKPGKGESGWCTSSPGGSMFDYYIKSGPLYVILPNDSEEFMSGGPKVGQVSGLPAKRYQFHFHSNQFMDANDRGIDLIDFLLANPELKEFFKPEFMKGLSNAEGTEISVEYPRDKASKFIALYGFDRFFEDLPNNLGRFDFIKGSGGSRYGQQELKDLNIKIPSTIGRFKNMYALHLDGMVDELPSEISNLEDLMFLSLPNNKNLKSLPKEMAEKNGNDYRMKNLAVITLAGSNPNIEIPEEVQKMIEDQGIKVFK